MKRMEFYTSCEQMGLKKPILPGGGGCRLPGGGGGAY